MDLSVILSTGYDFAKILIVLSIISFVAYKMVFPVRERFAEKFSLSWAKSTLAINFVLIMILIIGAYVYFLCAGILAAPVRDPDIDFTWVDAIILFISAVPRLLIATGILSLLLLCFELLASFFMTKKEGKRGKAKNLWVGQVVGIVISCAVFLLLILFVFDWLPLGLVLFIFYGSIKGLPLVILV